MDVLMRLALYAGLALFAVAAPASADVKTACKKDVEANCKDVKAGGGKLLSCIAQNRAKVSSECKVAIADRLLERRAKADSDKKSGKSSSKDDDD